jgi:hypothetical protein
MNEKEKIILISNLREHFFMSLTDAYDKLKNAIKANNLQSIYELSKIITRYYFKELEE